MESAFSGVLSFVERFDGINIINYETELI